MVPRQDSVSSKPLCLLMINIHKKKRIQCNAMQWDLEETTTNIESFKLQVPEQARGDMS